MTCKNQNLKKKNLLTCSFRNKIFLKDHITIRKNYAGTMCLYYQYEEGCETNYFIQ